jgi:quercetin dioxygenase-like cupin family protein
MVPLSALADIAAGLALSPIAMPPNPDGERHQRGSMGLLASDAYDVWLLRWPPGSNVEPHDHGDAHGAFTVVTGTLDEVRWERGTRRIRRLHAGDAAAIPVGQVHDVVGVGAGTAVSVHAYSPPLREMRFYDDDAERVLAVELVESGAPVLDRRDAATALHPAMRPPAAVLAQDEVSRRSTVNGRVAAGGPR